LVAAAVAVSVLGVGCTGGDETPAAPPPTSLPTTPTSQPSQPEPTEKQDRGTTGWGPTHAEVQSAGRMADRLSVRQLAGQVIVAAYAGTAAPVDMVRRYHLGGVIVMSENAPSVADASGAMAELRASVDRPWPLWTSVDQEGGIVTRLGAPMTPFPAYMSHGAARDPDVTTTAARASGSELRSAGFTVVYAPVADVTTGPSDPTIGSRSAGSSPALVARTVAASVRGYRQAGIIAVVKHFPGHGSVPQDSHEVLPVQTAPQGTLASRDLVPFAAAVARGASAVMAAHIDVRALDPGVPSSLSERVVSGLLRQRLGFHGVVVTDALNMAAIVNEYGSGEAAVRALAAGGDVLLMPSDVPAAIDAISTAVANGRLPLHRLRQAATRMIALLLYQERLGRSPSPPDNPERASLAVSRAAVTQVSGRCGSRLVEDAVLPLGDPAAVATFTAAADQAGLVVGSGSTVRFLGPADAPGSADVVVSTDTPYVLGPSDGAVAEIALFGQTPQAMRALIEVLTGRRTAPGRLPVDVSGATRVGC